MILNILQLELNCLASTMEKEINTRGKIIIGIEMFSVFDFTFIHEEI